MVSVEVQALFSLSAVKSEELSNHVVTALSRFLTLSGGAPWLFGWTDLRISCEQGRAEARSSTLWQNTSEFRKFSFKFFSGKGRNPGYGSTHHRLIRAAGVLGGLSTSRNVPMGTT